jgi:hypothetical protein
MGSEHAIPEDLLELYSVAQSWRHYHGSEPYFGSGKVEVLIERIAELEAQTRKLIEERDSITRGAMAQVAALSKPVSDEEWNADWTMNTGKDFFNEIIASRLHPAPEEPKP